MPYQFCYQCNFGWVFLAVSIASCIVAIFHANRGNPDKAIWPIRVTKWLTYTPYTYDLEKETRHDLSKFSWQERLKAFFWYSAAIEKATRGVVIKYSWRERFMAAWFAWLLIGFLALIVALDMLTMVGVITAK